MNRVIGINASQRTGKAIDTQPPKPLQTVEMGRKIISVKNSMVFTKLSAPPKTPRTITLRPSPKPYNGFDRLSQVLRHLSTAIYHSIKNVGNTSPIEVQCSTFFGKTHISVNAHSELVIPALQYFLKKEVPDGKSKSTVSHAKSRLARHSKKLNAFVVDDIYFNNVLSLAAMEVRNGKGSDDRLRINPECIVRQFEFGMNLLREALIKAADDDFSLIEVHSLPLNLGFAYEGGAVRHAERSIVDYLAKNQAKIPGFATELGIPPLSPIIIPIEGRFVPCALCYAFEDAEKTPGEGGIFDSGTSRLALYRSTGRAGKFYWNEDQILSIRGLAQTRSAALDRGSRILHEMIHGGGVTADMQYTPDSALNTDSDSD